MKPLRMHNPPHPGEIIRDICLAPLSLTAQDLARRSSGTSATAGGRSAGIDESYRSRMLPGYPGLKLLDKNDTISFELFTGPNGRKVVEHIQISCDPGTA